MAHTICHTNLKIGQANRQIYKARFPACMMLESGRIRLVRPSALIIAPIKSERPAKLPIAPRYTFGPYNFQKNSKKAVYRALFLTRDYNTKSQKSKKLPGKL
jgi:hypothetical protein